MKRILFLLMAAMLFAIVPARAQTNVTVGSLACNTAIWPLKCANVPVTLNGQTGTVSFYAYQTTHWLTLTIGSSTYNTTVVGVDYTYPAGAIFPSAATFHFQSPLGQDFDMNGDTDTYAGSITFDLTYTLRAGFRSTMHLTNVAGGSGAFEITHD